MTCCLHLVLFLLLLLLFVLLFDFLVVFLVRRNGVEADCGENRSQDDRKNLVHGFPLCSSNLGLTGRFDPITSNNAPIDFRLTSNCLKYIRTQQA